MVKKKAKKQSKKPAKTKAKKAKAPKAAKKSTKHPKKQKKAVSPENFFFTADGRTISDLLELADALDEISDEVFFHHVNEQKNDFSNWIREVMDEPKLADEIIEIRVPIKTQVIILKHLVKKRGR